MFSISARLIETIDEQMLLERFGLQPGGPVQHAISEAIVSTCRDYGYVPASPNYTLTNAVIIDDEGGRVIWNTPYAHYQYVGIVYGPNIPIIEPETGVLLGYFSPPGKAKHPTDKRLTYDTAQNPLAGPYWFERAKADHMSEWLDEARRVMIQGE